MKNDESQVYSSESENSSGSENKPRVSKAKGKVIYATMENNQKSNNSSNSGEKVTVVDDSIKNEEKLIIRTQDENYGWKSFDVSGENQENSKNERMISIKETAKFIETDTERQHIERTEVLRTEIVALDQEIGELHKTISQEDKLIE